MHFLQTFFWAMPVISAIGSVLLLVIFLVAKRDKAMQYFAFLLASLAVWSVSSLMVRLQLWPGVLFWIIATQ